MILSDVAIERRTTVFVLIALVLAMGIFSYNTLPRESEPEIVIPIVTVSVRYEGVSPSDMETLVTSPIERKLTGISGIKQIMSSSNEGSAVIVLEFDPKVDVDSARQKVKDKVDLAKADIPEDTDDPIVQTTNMAESPVMFVALTGPVSLTELTDIGEELEDRIEALPDILDVVIMGDVEREIQIMVDPARMVHYGISLAQIADIARVENVNTPAGSIEVGEAKYLMRVPGEIEDPDDLRDLVVKRGESGIVYLRDLAEIKDGFKDAETFSRLDRSSSITIVATKRAGVNIIKVSKQVRAILEDARGSLPAGVSLDITMDESERIGQMNEQLESSIMTGLILVWGVVFIFLGLSNGFFVALAIPISLLVAFIVMYLTGMTLNMVTLFSLMVALGMLVDNGIVVIENIYRHAQLGYSRIEAAKLGTAEVGWPIFGSTLTTVVAFFPMVFWPGMMGRFMSLLPITVIITLFASLFVGLIVNPALASAFVHVREKNMRGSQTKAHPILDAYGSVLKFALRWRMVTVTLAVMTLVTITGVFAAGAQFEFLSTIEPDRAYIDIEMPEGTNLEMTDLIAREVERIAGVEQGKLDYMVSSVGSTGPSVREGIGRPDSGGNSSHTARITMVFPNFDDKVEMPSEIIKRTRTRFDHIVGADIRFGEASMGPPSGAPINIEISGDDFGELAAIARRLEDEIRDVPGLVDLQDDMDRGKPEVRVVIDRQAAALANLNTQYIGMTVQAAVHGRKAAEYREGDDEYDVVVMYPKRFRDDLSKIEGMSLINLAGVPIPFSSVARLEQGAGLGSITRVDRKRTVTVKAEGEDRPGAEVLSDVQDRLEDFYLPPGYTLAYTGENRELNESGMFLVQAFVIALFLILIVLITQFNSIVQPFIIMSSVILSLGGVFLGLIIFDMPFSFMMTGIGCVSLSGIVVNNGIVLVDYINKLRAQGLSDHEAIVRAGKTRFRPVLLTAVTTILGLAPLGVGISFDFRKLEIVSGGSQSSYWGAMAVAIIFGLTFATVLTLVVIPVLYSLSLDLSAMFSKESATDADTLPNADLEPIPK